MPPLSFLSRRTVPLDKQRESPQSVTNLTMSVVLLMSLMSAKQNIKYLAVPKIMTAEAYIGKRIIPLALPS